MTEQESNTLKLLKRRVERLISEYEMDAPSVIKENELRLINQAFRDVQKLGRHN